jgi:hypothetical protein
MSNDKQHSGHRRLPYVFTEQGMAMLSNEKLQKKLIMLEEKYDQQFKCVFDAIRQLMEPEPVKPKNPIGFAPWPKNKATKANKVKHRQLAKSCKKLDPKYEQALAEEGL